MEENSLSKKKQGLDRAEELAERDELEAAQSVLDGIDEKNARWHYVQSRIYIKKNWLNEARKQLEIAVKSEPENGTYINALNNLEYRAQSGEDKMKGSKKKRSGDNQEMGSFCAECCCEGCLGGLCGAACDGCG